MNPDTRKKFENLFMTGLIILAVSFYLLFISRTAFTVRGETYFTLVDDAMISMRYARNLANGHGLVWNIGAPPVEGFTNLGWTLLMAGAHRLPVSQAKVSLLVMMASAGLLVGNVIVAFKLVRHLAPDSILAPGIAAVITAFYFPLVFWSLRGLELGAAVFLVYTAVLLALQIIQAPAGPGGLMRRVLLGLLLATAVLVRMDLVLQIGVLLGYLVWQARRSSSVLRERAGVLPVALALDIGLGGVLWFQYKYFGSALPNTYFLKVAGVTLAERINLGVQVFSEYAVRDFAAILSVSVLGLLLFRDLRRREFLLLAGLFLVQCGYSIYVGGDYAEPLFRPQVDAANRFIAQGMLSVIIMFSLAIERILVQGGLFQGELVIPGRKRLKWIAGIGFAALMIMSGEPWFMWSIHNAPLLDDDIRRAKVGLHLEAFTDPQAVVACHAAGNIPYYSNRPTIDLLGISDPVIAHGPPAAAFRPGHNKWNYAYSIGQLLPDVIADGYAEADSFLQSHSDYCRQENGFWVHCRSPRILPGFSASYDP